MTKKQRAETVMTELEKLYPQTPIPLDHFDPYTLLVAVALSAQTTDKKVNEITPVLFAKAQTPQQMARLEEFEIKELIKEIGLSNTKAKTLNVWPNFSWKDMRVLYRKVLRNWKLFRVLVIKRHL